jgi:MFS transporter, DHA1 family, tetracycline resistance protein
LESATPVKNARGATLGLVFLTLFIDMIGFGIVIPVLPLFAEGTRFNASESQLAWIVGIYSLLQVVASPIIGRISDRVGRKPVLAISILGTAVGFTVLGAATTVTMLVIGRIIDGISGGNISTAMACIADSTSREQRSRAMGLVGAAFGLGFVIGPALGGVLSKFGASVPFYFAAVLALINSILVMARLPETLTPEARERAREKASIGEVFRGRAGTVGIALVSQLAGVTGFSVMTALFAIFCARRYGYDAAHVGYVLAYVGLLGAIMQGGVLRRLLRKPIEKPLAIIGTAVLSLSMASLALLPTGTGWGALLPLLVVCAGISIGNSLSTPTLNGLASRTVDAHCQGRLMGMMQSAGGLGRFLGPMLGYSLIKYDGANAYGHVAFLASAGLLAMDCVLLLFLHAPPPPDNE